MVEDRFPAPSGSSAVMARPPAVAWIDSSVDQMLFRVLCFGSGLSYPELFDGFAADNSPGSPFFDLVDSPHSWLLFETEKPEAVPRTVRTTGEGDGCFGFAASVDSSVPLGWISPTHTC